MNQIMTDEDIDHNEHILLGSILTSDDNENIPDCISIKGVQNKKYRNEIEANYQSRLPNAQDPLQRSLEHISFVSDYLESPLSPDSQLFRNNLYNQASSSFSFDGQSTQENSMIFCNSSCFELYQKQQDQISPVQFNNTGQLWMNYQKMNKQNFDIQLQNDIDNMCGNQLISRRVQKIFETGTSNQKQQIFQKVEQNSLEFSKDIFGNYLVQKILERGSLIQRAQIFNQLKPYFHEVSINQYGCRVIQKLIEVISTDEKMMNLMADFIKNNIKILLLDQNGKYVILKLLEGFQKEKIEFLIQPIDAQCRHMCQSQYGCKIIQKVLENYPLSMEKLLQNCISHQQLLYQSEFGNHILQFSLKKSKHVSKIANYVFQNLEQLCFNKYASNTVEALLDYLDIDQKQAMINILMNQSQLNGQIIFVNISINPFGNYVIKRLLQQFNQELLLVILQHMKQNPNQLMSIRYSEFGQRIYTLLSTQLNDDK